MFLIVDTLLWRLIMNLYLIVRALACSYTIETYISHCTKLMSYSFDLSKYERNQVKKHKIHF